MALFYPLMRTGNQKLLLGIQFFFATRATIRIESSLFDILFEVTSSVYSAYPLSPLCLLSGNVDTVLPRVLRAEKTAEAK